MNKGRAADIDIGRSILLPVVRMTPVRGITKPLWSLSPRKADSFCSPRVLSVSKEAPSFYMSTFMRID
jgi:hypothetical protein